MSAENSIEREKRVNPVRNVAVVGLLDDEQRILLVRTNRLPEKWQPIGGGMKPFDKTPIDTLIRELEEETTLKFNADQFQFEIECDYDFGQGKVFFYTAHIRHDSPIIFDTVEIAEWKWFELAETESINAFPATIKFLKHLLPNR